jgi:CubicO group peptidase (beta-lactamase class C family)
MPRRTTFFVAAALAVLLQVVTPRAQSPATSGSVTSVDNPLQLIDLFRDYVEALRVQSGIPGLSVAVVGRTDILWERGFGQQDVDKAVSARPDTPYQLDGLVQPLTAALVLRCVEDGRLRLEDALGTYAPNSPEAGTTIQQVLGQTTLLDGAPSFLLRPTRYDLLTAPLESCSGKPLRETYADLLDRLAMVDSLPGMDAVRALSPAQSKTDSLPSEAAARLERYTSLLDRLATPYAVDAQRRATASRYTAATLSPSAGLISTVRDLAKFDLALRRGVLLRPDTLSASWKAQVGRDEKPLPYGLGWFVQSYRGEPVLWQFGVSDNASSSLMVTLPSRGLTLILLANSSGLVKNFPVAAGDLTASPFGRVILGFFVR